MTQPPNPPAQPNWGPPTLPPSSGAPQPGPIQWQQPDSERGPVLPLEPREYQQFWRAPRWRWWKMLLVLGIGFVLFMAAQVVALLAAITADDAAGRVSAQEAYNRLQKGELQVTPAFFTANNVSLALLIPLSMLLARWLTGQGPKWLSSVVGGLRWAWLGRCFAVLLPLWLVYTGIQWYFASQSSEGLGLAVNEDTVFLVLAILITTPFQAAGEEYGFRGLVNRAAGSFFANRWAALAAGMLLSSTLFMLAHGAGDPWLNVFYFSFGVVACIMTWRTGGLEAAIAMHVINNVLSEATMPFSDISGMFNREAGVANAGILFNVMVPVIGLGLVEWQARRAKLVRVGPTTARAAEVDVATTL